MAVGVVKHLEVVDIHHHHAIPQAVGLRLLGQARNFGIKGFAVGKRSQAVGERLFAHRLQVALKCLHHQGRLRQRVFELLVVGQHVAGVVQDRAQGAANLFTFARRTQLAGGGLQGLFVLVGGRARRIHAAAHAGDGGLDARASFAHGFVVFGLAQKTLVQALAQRVGNGLLGRGQGVECVHHVEVRLGVVGKPQFVVLRHGRERLLLQSSQGLVGVQRGRILRAEIRGQAGRVFGGAHR